MSLWRGNREKEKSKNDLGWWKGKEHENDWKEEKRQMERKTKPKEEPQTKSLLLLRSPLPSHHPTSPAYPPLPLPSQPMKAGKGESEKIEDEKEKKRQSGDWEEVGLWEKEQLTKW